jgi:hypothetical protein
MYQTIYQYAPNVVFNPTMSRSMPTPIANARYRDLNSSHTLVLVSWVVVDQLLHILKLGVLTSSPSEVHRTKEQIHYDANYKQKRTKKSTNA